METENATGSTELTLEDRLTAFNFTKTTFNAFPRVRKAIKQHGASALADLYDFIRSKQMLAKMFRSDAMMGEARKKRFKYWMNLFAGPGGEDYNKAAHRIGTVHAAIGLAPTWYISSYARMLEATLQAVIGRSVTDPFGNRSKAANALIKASLLDMDIALSAYFDVEEAKRRKVIDGVSKALDHLASGNFSQRMADLPEGYEALSRDFRSDAHAGLRNAGAGETHGDRNPGRIHRYQRSGRRSVPAHGPTGRQSRTIGGRDGGDYASGTG